MRSLQWVTTEKESLAQQLSKGFPEKTSACCAEMLWVVECAEHSYDISQFDVEQSLVMVLV